MGCVPFVPCAALGVIATTEPQGSGRAPSSRLLGDLSDGLSERGRSARDGWIVVPLSRGGAATGAAGLGSRLPEGVIVPPHGRSSAGFSRASLGRRSELIQRGATPGVAARGSSSLVFRRPAIRGADSGVSRSRERGTQHQRLRSCRYVHRPP